MQTERRDKHHRFQKRVCMWYISREMHLFATQHADIFSCGCANIDKQDFAIYKLSNYFFVDLNWN